MSKRTFKILYKETYKKLSAFIRSNCLPELKHTNGMQPFAIELLCAGTCELDGVKREFQDLRVYFHRDSEPPVKTE